MSGWRNWPSSPRLRPWACGECSPPPEEATMLLLAQRRPPDEHAACATLLFGPLALPAAVQGHCCGLQHHGVRPGQESSIDTISTCRRQTRFRAAFISDARKCVATWHNRVNSVQSTRECLRRMLGQQHWDSSPNSQSHRPTLSCASLRWHACPVPCRLFPCHYRTCEHRHLGSTPEQGLRCLRHSLSRDS